MMICILNVLKPAFRSKAALQCLVLWRALASLAWRILRKSWWNPPKQPLLFLVIVAYTICLHVLPLMKALVSWLAAPNKCDPHRYRLNFIHSHRCYFLLLIRLRIYPLKFLHHSCFLNLVKLLRLKLIRGMMLCFSSVFVLIFQILPYFSSKWARVRNLLLVPRHRHNFIFSNFWFHFSGK